MNHKLKNRDSNNKSKIVCIILLLLLFTGIGFGYVKTTLKINGYFTFGSYPDAVIRTNLMGKDFIAYKDDRESQYVSNSNGVNYESNTNYNNGQGLYLMMSTKNDEYPIYYYRGAVTDNNVLFAGKCWKIVRTTNTGGTKLLYNGIPNEENEYGKCANTGLDSTIGTVPYTSSNNFLNLGYMYNANNYNYVIGSITTNSDGTIRYDTTPIGLNDYKSIQNDFNEDYQFTFDENTNKWTSNMHDDNGSASISFSIPTEGEYLFIYTISSEENYDMAYVYVNDVQKGVPISGKDSGFIHLGNVLPTDVITVKYVKDGSVSNYSDNIKFSIGNNLSSLIDERWLFGNEVTYQDGEYILNNSERIQLSEDLGNYHYSCFTTSNSCSEVNYIYYRSGNTIYYVSLSNGKRVNDVISDLLPNDESRNQIDSNVKEFIDNWFSSENGLLNYVDYLEDTVWCSNRNIINSGGWSSTGSLYQPLEFEYNTLYYSGTKNVPSLTCSNVHDRFTLKTTSSNSNETLNGNGLLDYPVGLLTIDETLLSGIGYNSFLVNNNLSYWISTPISFYNNSGYITTYNIDGSISNSITSNSMNIGVRPSISLKNGISISDGKGTMSNPYIIAE